MRGVISDEEGVNLYCEVVEYQKKEVRGQGRTDDE